MDEKRVYGNGQKALNIILSAFFLAAVIVIFGSQIFLVVTLRMPKTFREMTMIKYALDFSRGINPYASELLNDDLPFNSGCYGFLQAILTAGILKFVSLKNALLATELLSLGLDMLSALFLYLTLRGRQCERWIALFAATVISLVLYQSGAAYPHSIGMLLLFFTIWLVGKDTRKEKYHPFAYAVLAILSFYAKQYFLIMAPCLFIYLLIRSPKDALKLTIYGIVIGFGSLIAVYFVLPAADAGKGQYRLQYERVYICSQTDLSCICQEISGSYDPCICRDTVMDRAYVQFCKETGRRSVRESAGFPAVDLI